MFLLHRIPLSPVARNSAHPAAVLQHLHLMLALLSRVGDGPRGRRGPGTLKQMGEAVDVDGRAAAHATRQCEAVDVGADDINDMPFTTPSAQ